MEPIKGNSLNKSCGEIISSNCVTWAGGAVDGVCGPNPSLTQVVQSAINNSSACCEGSFPSGHQSCYTGQWVDFSSSIPTVGSGSGYAYTITSYGGGIGLNNPQYKWTRDGDLKIRGGFVLNITPSSIQVSFSVPLITFATTCFPTGFTGAQFAITTTHPFATNGQIITGVMSCGLLLSSAGVLSIEGGFINTTLVAESSIIGLGGTTFNLA